MKGKVTCTCGWSWNKSDSSKKDMYICHECGRDNSNNMKNGGDIPQAQDGDLLDKWRADHPTVRSFINNTQNRKIQAYKGKGKETNVTQKDNTKTVNSKVDKVNKVKPLTQKEKDQRAEEWNKQAYEQSKKEAQIITNKKWVNNSMKEVIHHPLFNPGYFTPEGAIIGSMQAGLHSGLDFYEGDYKGAAINAGFAALPFVPKIIKTAKSSFSKAVPIEENIFSTYVNPQEAAAARAERMLAQESKWKVNSNDYTKDKFTNINDNFEEVFANEIGKSPEVLGTNALGKAFVFKDNGLSAANQSRVAAHETGHFYRNMADEANEWNSFFDFSKLKHRTKVYLKGKATASGSSNVKPDVKGLNLQKEGVPHGDEIRERAAQLKDYIAQKNGIPLNKDFTVTQAQLDDAIENYVKDTGLDNSMSLMLNSLKDKKGFLKAMNKYALGVVPLAVGVGQLEKQKNGGWLDRYADGGTMQEHQENYNDYKVSAPEGFKGNGYSNVGRNYSPAWGGQFQMGGDVYPVNYIPQAQNGNKKKKKGVVDLLRDAEDSVNKSLGYPMGKAHTAAEELAAPWYNPKTKKWEFNDPVDNFRHPMAGRYTSEAIQDKLYNIPILSQMAGMVGSNALGIGHELSTLINPKDKRGWYDKIREFGEDTFNNAVGATVGSLPISGKAKTNMLVNLSNKNMIPDGVSGKGGDMYIKHAMGGSIPGTPGFTYARTQGIPSEGPYAKKTMPSAQTGNQVLPNNNRALQILANIQKRKQEKPKTNAQKALELLKNSNVRFDKEQRSEDYRRLVESKAYKDQVKADKIANDKAILADRKARMADAMKAQNEDIIGNPNWREVLARETQSTGDKFRIFPNDPNSFIDDWLNPGVMIGDMASDLGSAPLRAKQENSYMPYVTSIGVPLLTGALEGIGAKTNKQFISNIFNPVNMVPGYKSAEKYVGKKIGNQVSNITGSGLGYRNGGEIEDYPEAQFGRLIKKGVKAVGNEAKLIKKGIKTSAKDYGNLLKDLPKAKSVKEAVGRVAGLPIEGTLPRLSPEELKIFRQVQEVGRMRATGKPISQQYKYALEQGLPEEHLKKAFGKTKAEIENAIPNAQEQEAFRLANPIRDRINLQRPPRTTSSSDAAIDQMNAAAAPIGSDQDIQNARAMFDHLRVSPITSPPVLQTDSSIFRMDPNLLAGLTSQVNPSKAQDFVQQAISPIRDVSNAASSRLMNIVQDYPYYAGPIQQNVLSLSLRGSGSLKNVSDEVISKGTRNVQSGDVYTGSLNTSHSSYLPQLKQVFKSTEGAPQFFGYRPMNTMGFLSDFNYSSDDIAKYLNTEIDEQIRRGIIPNNIQRPYVKGNDVFLPHYGIKQFREGGIIDSDRGQWDYPGEITRINSNEITMGPDPKTGKPLTKPLLGISDTGDVKLMRPGGNYKFDGKRVTEYPIAQSGLTMGTTSTENDVRESSAQSAKANTKAKKQAKLEEAQLLAEQEENRRNLFARDIKVRQPDGTILIVNTGSPEYEELYKAGEIQSPGAGEGDVPYFGGELPEVILQQEMTPLLQAKRDYGFLSNKEAFVNRKKDEYLKSLGTKNNWFGADRNNMPENVLRDIEAEYNYNQNTRAIEDVARAKGFDLNTRGNWIYNLTPSEREALINSKYSSQLNPNEFSEMASGVQQLANTLVPGKPWNLDIPGLTQRELEEDRESWMSPLKTFAPLNIPGNAVANYLKNSSDYVENPFLGMQRMGNVDVWDSMAMNPLNLPMITGAANLAVKAPGAISNTASAIGKGANLAIENAPAAMSFAADAVKDVRGVVKQYKEIGKIKNQDDYYNSVVNSSKYIDDLPKTGMGASGGVTNANELYDLMTTLSGNFKSYLKRMGGEEFAKTEADKWKQNFVNTDLAKRMEDAIDKNLPLSPEVYKQLAIDFSNSFPKGKSLIAPAKKELAKIQKNIIFNKEKDYETIKEFAKNLKIKIPKRPDKVEYSPKERETIDAIRELGKYKSVANYRKDQLLSDPEAMVNINKLILKLDDDVIENILKITKSELLNRYKNIVPDLKKTQVDITSNPIPNADLWLVNEQNILQPGGVDDLHILNEKQLLAPELKHQTLTDRIGQSYARNFEPVNYEKPSSYPQDLIFMAKTDYQYRNAKDAAGNYLFDVYNNPIEKLVAEGNVKQLLLGAVKRVKASPKGSNFVGSSSLSSDSYPLTLDAGIMMSEKGLVDVGVDAGTMYLNDMGYTHSSPGLVIKDINSKIEQLEKLSGKKLPRAKYDPKADRYRMYKVPKIYFTRLKQGGSINKADENSLVKLDQLTNFTNYNKPQPGGWLNKYE